MHVPINQAMFQQYPLRIRSRYAAVVQDREPATRHSRLIKLGEETLGYLASTALSDYRNRRHNDPDVHVEQILAGTKRMSLGHYLQVFRASTEAIQPALFDYKSRAETESSSAIGRFTAGVHAIEDAIALDANNLKRLIGQRLDNPPKVSWLQFWERFIEYRNKADAHAATHQWPIDHPDYYALMTPLLEEALVAATTATHVQRVFADHPAARLEDIKYEDGAYLHEVLGEDLGLPFEATVALDRSATDVWARPGWKAEIGSDVLLTRLPSGAFELSGIFHDILQQGPPAPLEQPAPAATPVLRASAGSTTPWRSGVAVAAGTCGELIQGFTASGEPFHVTCPIQKSSTISLRVRSAPDFAVELSDSHLHKLELALYRTAEVLELEPLEIRVERWTDLDVGKGMGSSTADIVAAARALAAAADRELDTVQLARIATAIESSDGSMFPELLAFDQKSGRVVRQFDWWPQFVICMVVPTQAFNTESANFRGKEAFGAQFDDMLDSLAKAAVSRDSAAWAIAATESARINQRFVPNAMFSVLSAHAERLGALGVNVGHTGTVAGLLFDASEPDAMATATSAALELERLLPASVKIEVTVTPPSPDDA
jgi:L-threonine kinase